MEVFKKPFTQVVITDILKKESTNKIKASKLLGLLSKDFQEEIKKEFGIVSSDFYIQIDNIDIAYEYVKYVNSLYQYINLYSTNKEVQTHIKENEEKKNELYFKIESLFDEEGVIYENIEAKAEYESVSMFYNDRELSKHINFLKNKKSTIDIKYKNKLIENIDASWNDFYNKNPKLLSKRKFRFLKDKNEKYFLRSITSSQYKEYGVAFCFVISMISLWKAMERDKGIKFKISFLSINESKIDIVISNGNSIFVEEINHYLSSSIMIRNNDLGNSSLSFTHTLKLTPSQNNDDAIYLFPKLKTSELNYKTSIKHTSGIDKVCTMFSEMEFVLKSVDNYIEDFKGIANTHTYDELRSKIEEKLYSTNSPFKDVSELKDLFKRGTKQHIDNLGKLLEVCQKTELINLDYDLRFKLRYLISNVLLYGKNDI
ncbi:hypothetical protein HX096_16560 [Empedobacter falsenii]|uniref:hypothetical protein n=1 Tax=Empedobacter falsenii TaxID=343874 RepID=UPI0025782A05|nr:hypothetical protein [Empedobacter falsenii]MDM1549466.1 hypothetical protein [Empedobacter falsenii]